MPIGHQRSCAIFGVANAFCVFLRTVALATLCLVAGLPIVVCPYLPPQRFSFFSLNSRSARVEYCIEIRAMLHGDEARGTCSLPSDMFFAVTASRR